MEPWRTQVCEEVLNLHLGFLEEGVHPLGEGLLLNVESLLLQGPDSPPLEILGLNFIKLQFILAIKTSLLCSGHSYCVWKPQSKTWYENVNISQHSTQFISNQITHLDILPCSCLRPSHAGLSLYIPFNLQLFINLKWGSSVRLKT